MQRRPVADGVSIGNRASWLVLQKSAHSGNRREGLERSRPLPSLPRNFRCHREDFFYLGNGYIPRRLFRRATRLRRRRLGSALASAGRARYAGNAAAV